jgi:hypothetical protein
VAVAVAVVVAGNACMRELRTIRCRLQKMKRL